MIGPAVKTSLKNTTFVNSKRQNQTLKSILVRASFQNSELHKPTISLNAEKSLWLL